MYMLSYQTVQLESPCFNRVFISFFTPKEESLRGRPGYEHLSEQLHILIEAELHANVIDARLRQAQEIIEELLKPVVCLWIQSFSVVLSGFSSIFKECDSYLIRAILFFYQHADPHNCYQ